MESVSARAQGLARVRKDLFVPNGPCFLADGTLLIADTARRLIYAVGLDANGNPMTSSSRSSRCPGLSRRHDHQCREPHWIAFWDAWCMRRIAPEAHQREIPLPVQRPTCPASAATARYGLRHQRDDRDRSAALATQPRAGGLLMSTGVRGLARTVRGLIAVVHETIAMPIRRRAPVRPAATPVASDASPHRVEQHVEFAGRSQQERALQPKRSARYTLENTSAPPAIAMIAAGALLGERTQATNAQA